MRTHINFPSAALKIPGLPSYHLLLMPGSHHSFCFHLFSLALSLSLSLCPYVIPRVLPSPLATSAEEDKRELHRETCILLASMRKPETGRESEQCQQIREVQKPPQEACQSSSITRASETQRKNMRTANCARMSSLAAKSSQTASDKTVAICSVLFWDFTRR